MRLRVGIASVTEEWRVVPGNSVNQHAYKTKIIACDLPAAAVTQLLEA